MDFPDHSNLNISCIFTGHFISSLTLIFLCFVQLHSFILKILVSTFSFVKDTILERLIRRVDITSFCILHHFLLFHAYTYIFNIYLLSLFPRLYLDSCICIKTWPGREWKVILVNRLN